MELIDWIIEDLMEHRMNEAETVEAVQVAFKWIEHVALSE